MRLRLRRIDLVERFLSELEIVRFSPVPIPLSGTTIRRSVEIIIRRSVLATALDQAMFLARVFAVLRAGLGRRV